MSEPIAYPYATWIGYMTHPEVDFLIKLTRLLPKNPVIVNIGAGIGTSALCFMEARDDLVYYSVDIRNDVNSIGGLINEANALKGEGFWDTRQIHQIHGDSKDVGRDWKFGKVDLVFIDGDHSHEGCMGDWLQWKNHIKPGGIVAFHDYKSIYGPGVETCVIEVEKKHKRIECVDTLVAFWMSK